MRHVRYTLGVCSVAMGMLCLTLSVQAEMYVAGQMGVNIPRDLSNVELSGFGTTLGVSDLSLQNSLMYGVKAGYYFDSLKWQNFNLGVETEVFNSTPHIKQQDATIGGISGTLPGLTNRVLTWAPLVVVVRYQAGAFGGENSSRNRLSDSMGSGRISVSNDRRAGLPRRISKLDSLMGQ